MNGEEKTDSAASESLARHSGRPPRHGISRLQPLSPHGVDRALLDYATDEMSSFSELNSDPESTDVTSDSHARSDPNQDFAGFESVTDSDDGSDEGLQGDRDIIRGQSTVKNDLSELGSVLSGSTVKLGRPMATPAPSSLTKSRTPSPAKGESYFYKREMLARAVAKARVAEQREVEQWGDDDDDGEDDDSHTEGIAPRVSAGGKAPVALRVSLPPQPSTSAPIHSTPIHSPPPFKKRRIGGKCGEIVGTSVRRPLLQGLSRVVEVNYYGRQYAYSPPRPSVSTVPPPSPIHVSPRPSTSGIAVAGPSRPWRSRARLTSPELQADTASPNDVSPDSGDDPSCQAGGSNSYMPSRQEEDWDTSAEEAVDEPAPRGCISGRGNGVGRGCRSGRGAGRRGGACRDRGVGRGRIAGRGRGACRGRIADRDRGATTAAAALLEEESEMEEEDEERRRQGRHADVWVWDDGADFVPQDTTFDPQAQGSGVTSSFPAGPNSSPDELFMAFFDAEVMTFIAEETNRQEALSRNIHGKKQSAKMVSWKVLTVPELYVFFALTMLMAHIKKHRVADYWLTGDIIATPAFGKYMSRDRYLAILSNLHLVTNTNVRLPDRLWKIRHFYELMRARFSSYFKPFQKVVIDESLVLFRGRLHFRQYIPSKRHRFGIKLFMLCDCQTGYVLDFVVYSGKEGDIVHDKDIGFGGAVVKTMMDRYFGKNHILYTDNYYTSPVLAEFLHANKTQCVGTVRKTRRHVPKFPTKTKKKDIFKKKRGPVLAIHWHDQRKVNMLTTIHEGRMVDTGKIDHRTRDRVLKPDVVVDYNLNMRLVDKSDMQVGFIDCLRTSCRWYKKFLLHMMDVSVLNAYNLYKVLNPTAPRTYKNLRRFHKQLVLNLLERYGTLTRVQSQPGAGAVDRVNEHHKKHMLVALPMTGNRKSQRRCHVCTHTTRKERKTTKSSYECSECKVALCITPCFAEFHSYTHF